MGSRQHARFRAVAGRWQVENMKSTAGVFVNNVKVEMSPLHNGDDIRLGNTELEFRE